MRPFESDPYEAWLAAWAAAWSLPELPYRVRIAFSSRLQGSLGRCSPRTGVIRLNPGLLDGPTAALREVVCHEAAHVATWLLYGRHASAHGREWRELMRLAGYEPRVRWAESAVPAAVRERRRSSAVYVHACPVCRAQWIARTTSSAWRCATCRDAGRDGRLTVSKREAAASSEPG
jgi:predicted SprT family Zn-dependent metalloprotease